VPKIDAALLASAMRGLMAVLILAAGLVVANALLKRWIAADPAPERTPANPP
jgi:hypothetical protein